MIVCTQCGNHNQDDDEFCGSCGKFLEWVGEKVDEPAPPPPPEPEVETADELERAVEDAAAAAAAEAEAQRRREAEAEAAAAAERRRAAAQAEAETEAQRRAEAQAEAEAQRRREEEHAAAAARAEAEEETARRAKEEADKKAAALLAKPRAQTPVQSPSPPPSEVAASKAEPAETKASAQQPVAQQPVAQQPQHVTAPRPDPKKTDAPRHVKPGDLICGQCGEGNDAQRRFCRKCGNSLAEAVTAAKPSWWRRLFKREKRPRGARGDRATRQRGRRAAGAARTAGWQANRLRYGVGRVLMLLALVGIVGAVALPGPRGAITDTASRWFRSAKYAVAPEYEAINAIGAEATSSVGDHDPGKLIDGASNTYWAEGAAGPGIGEIITIHFERPTDLDKVLITAGASGDDPFLSQPRPKSLHIVYDNGRGLDLALRDEAEPKEYDLEGAEGVTSMQIQIAEVYPSAQGGENTSISEIEFRHRKRAT